MVNGLRLFKGKIFQTWSISKSPWVKSTINILYKYMGHLIAKVRLSGLSMRSTKFMRLMYYAKIVINCRKLFS
jgi:hypothetical protein